ncbi:VOC family protein [Parasphingorhabdus sp.]|uniref:VOC family protein n=1 Tax=Parasphingorhabdus sp. TaxID=2709688 RepID=UPI002F93D85F
MAIKLNHTIIRSSDKEKAANFLTHILGLPDPKPAGHFLVVELDNEVSLDFMEKEGDVAHQHYAFQIEDADFDAVFGRIKAASIDYWADPARSQPGEINHRNGGRGVYFPDPDGHLLEVLTRP